MPASHAACPSAALQVAGEFVRGGWSQQVALNANEIPRNACSQPRGQISGAGMMALPEAHVTRGCKAAQAAQAAAHGRPTRRTAAPQ